MQHKLALVTCLMFMSTPLLIPSSAQGEVISFSLSMEFSEAVPPEGTPPWLIATFDDQGTPGTVNLTLEATNLCPAYGTDGSEFVFEWLFNFDPTLDPTALVFNQTGKTGEFVDPAINLGIDDISGFQADGDGFFDIQVAFSNINGPKKKFGCPQPGNPIETVTFEITAPTLPDITASSFDYMSYQDGGQGIYPTAAKVGGIGENDESGWISIPEPITFLFFALGSLALVQRRRKK
jgi:hypothetical protein